MTTYETIMRKIVKLGSAAKARHLWARLGHRGELPYWAPVSERPMR